jgi:hypothetical protein
MSNIPGTVARHRIISRNCRRRHIGEIIAEVNESVTEELVALDESWPKDSDVRFHVVVTVERPAPADRRVGT